MVNGQSFPLQTNIPITLTKKRTRAGRFLQAFKSQLEETRILPGIKVKVPLEKKLIAGAVATGVVLIPGAAPLLLRGAKAVIVPKTVTGGLVRLGVAGALVTSPGLREAIVKTPKTVFEFGKKVGGKIEEIGKNGLKIPGAGALLGAGVLGALIPGLITALGRRRERVATQRLPAAILPAQVIPSVAPAEPLGAVQPAPVNGVKEAVPSFNIKNTFKPEINIKISKSKRFINQQNLIRT